ncbi:hypothetical protein AMTRI_Chr01g131910 [Amborella trichopoda]
MDDLTRHLHDEVPWCMLFADDIVLIDEIRNNVNTKIELRKDALESKGFRISRTKIQYMECKFSNNKSRDEEVVKTDGHEVQKRPYFRYLGAGWAKWGCATVILCDRRIPMKLKGKFYRTVVRPTLLYGVECWADKKQYTHKMRVAEMRMLRWMNGKTRRDKIRNESIRESLYVVPLSNKMRESKLRWAGHVWRQHSTTPVRRYKCSSGRIEKDKG